MSNALDGQTCLLQLPTRYVTGRVVVASNDKFVVEFDNIRFDSDDEGLVIWELWRRHHVLSIRFISDDGGEEEPHWDNLFIRGWPKTLIKTFTKMTVTCTPEACQLTCLQEDAMPEDLRPLCNVV